MRILLLSGLGPQTDLDVYFKGSLFDDKDAESLARSYFGFSGARVSLDALQYRTREGSSVPLLRRGGNDEPSLTDVALEAILQCSGVDFERFSLDSVWSGDDEPGMQNPDAVLLSTTYICNQHTLDRAIAWVRARFGVPLVLGGQFSNIKFEQILRRHPGIYAILRGDGELGIPKVFEALAGRISLADVPNVVAFVDGRLVTSGLEYCDIEATPSPSFQGHHPVVPYESMRGCPFRCAFCSFPAASPQFRYKSAKKIAADWRRYAEENGTRHIRALDSIFTTPVRRMRELLPMLAEHDSPTWEGFSRANTLREEGLVELLEQGNCEQLAIGFESMSDRTLGFMNKKIDAEHNALANALLADSTIGCRGHFMVGYPGERPVDYDETRRYLVNDYAGEFKLSIFSFTDETMPVWDDAERFGIEIDPDDPEYGWSHIGMDVNEARRLHQKTINQVRWGSDEAVWLFWQNDFEFPLIPNGNRKADLGVQKLVERLAMLPIDFPDPATGSIFFSLLMEQLQEHGVELSGASNRALASTP